MVQIEEQLSSRPCEKLHINIPGFERIGPKQTNTQSQRCRDTATQRHRDSKTQRHTHTGARALSRAPGDRAETHSPTDTETHTGETQRHSDTRRQTESHRQRDTLRRRRAHRGTPTQVHALARGDTDVGRWRRRRQRQRLARHRSALCEGTRPQNHTARNCTSTYQASSELDPSKQACRRKQHGRCSSNRVGISIFSNRQTLAHKDITDRSSTISAAATAA